MYACMYGMQACIYNNIYICACINADKHVCVHVCVILHVCVCIHAGDLCVCVCVCVCACQCLCVCVCMRVRVRMHMRAHARVVVCAAAAAVHRPPISPRLTPISPGSAVHPAVAHCGAAYGRVGEGHALPPPSISCVWIAPGRRW